MDESQLIALAERLEAENDLSDARSHWRRGHPADALVPVANRAGFVRLAAWCLRAAASPPENTEDFKPVILDKSLFQVRNDKQDFEIPFMQRSETLPGPATKPSKPMIPQTQIEVLGCIAALAGMIFVFVLGVRSLLELLGFVGGQ